MIIQESHVIKCAIWNNSFERKPKELQCDSLSCYLKYLVMFVVSKEKAQEQSAPFAFLGCQGGAHKRAFH